MTNRRQFLQAGVALSATAALVAPLAAGAGPAPGATLQLRHFVYDTRFAESVAMAQSMRRSVPLAETNGDMTDLWFNQLYPQWKKQPEALGGMTTPQGLFVLETLASDHRMRVVQRREHVDGRGQQLVSWIIAPRGAA